MRRVRCGCRQDRATASTTLARKVRYADDFGLDAGLLQVGYSAVIAA
jgi:hypothetical protein